MANQHRALKNLLPHAWHPFFGRFGTLRPIQEKAIPEILTGKPVLVVSPAASGKTEAVMAPVAERRKQEGWPPVSVLYVTPTRALVNDLYARLEAPLRQMGLSLSRKTGDHPEFRPEKPTDVLITTPESWDSLLARHPAVLQTVEVLILDEVHLYAQSYRGDQVRVLIRRLDRLRRLPYQKIALSATISEAPRVARRFLGEEATIVEHRAPREIRASVMPRKGALRRLLDLMRQEDLRKVLFFSPTRRDAEYVAAKLRSLVAYPEAVWTHHASLSRREREAVEQALHRSRWGIVVATPTLELGIDVGDIDLVVMLRPPDSVATFLQRIGRGNRRRPFLRVVGLYGAPLERVFYEVLFERAQQGEVEPFRHEPAPSVAVQQILSYAYQRRRPGVPQSALEDILEPLEVFPPDLEPLLVHLVESGYLERRPPGLYFLGPRGRRLASLGRIHSNIEDHPTEYEVYHILTGERLGTIEKLAPSFALKGRYWQVVSVQRNRVFVEEVSAVAPPTGRKVFKGKGAALWPPELGLAVKARVFPNLEPRQVPVLRATGNRWLFFHFLGVLAGFVWASALGIQGVTARDYAGVILEVQGSADLDPQRILEVPLEALELGILEHWRRVRKFLDLGAFFEALNPDLRNQALLRAGRVHELSDLLWASRAVPFETLPPPAVSLDTLL